MQVIWPARRLHRRDSPASRRQLPRFVRTTASELAQVPARDLRSDRPRQPTCGVLEFAVPGFSRRLRRLRRVGRRTCRATPQDCAGLACSRHRERAVQMRVDRRNSAQVARFRVREQPQIRFALVERLAQANHVRAGIAQKKRHDPDAHAEPHQLKHRQDCWRRPKIDPLGVRKISWTTGG